MDDCLLLDRVGAAALLTVNRPERRNALSVQLRNSLSDALDDLAVDESVKVVVITGAGQAFCSGFDLEEFNRASADQEFSSLLWESSDRYHRTVWQFPLPTVAAVNGPAIAGGFDLAVMCDIRLASTRARFAHPERSFGDVVYGPLHDLVGGAVARELTLGGVELNAEEAQALRLVGAVVEPDDLRNVVLEWVERMCIAPRDVLIGIKAKALRRAGAYGAGRTLDL